MNGQLNVFNQPVESDVPGEGHKSPQPSASRATSRTQLRELPGIEFEDIFVCEIDESAGLRENTA